MSIDPRFTGLTARPILTMGLLALIGVAVGAPADAQVATGAAPDAGSSAGSNVSALQEVVVTGTSIRGINAETALPVQILSSKDIARTGATNVEQLLQSISATSSAGSVVSVDATGNLTGGIQTISLRGLGSSRTLVLINGKRASVYGGGSAGAAGNSVDIGAIPVGAIERVEVLKDGASAIYGSDAIAGVINFILKTNYQGLTATATVGTPTDSGGGTEETGSLYAGLGSITQDRWNFGVGLNMSHMSPIMGSSRDFATRYSPGYGNDVTSSFAFPANISIPKNPAAPKGATVSPGAPSSCGPDSLNDQFFPTQCRFDNTPFDSLQPLEKRGSVLLNGSFELSPQSELYANAMYSEVRTTSFVQPVPLSSGNPLQASNPYVAYLANLLATDYPGYTAVKPGQGAFLLPPGSPYYPAALAAQYGQAGQPLNLIYRDFANGGRQQTDIADTSRIVGGAKGSAAGWDYDVSILYSQVKVHEDLESGYPLYSKIMPLLDTGTINPFGPTTDPSALAAAKATEFIGQSFNSKTSLTSLGGNASREIATFSTGPLNAAVGAELRRETFTYGPATAIQTGDIAGEGGNQLPEDAKRNVYSAYVELNGYLLSSLDADVAVRYDNYQRVGSTINPKVSLRWQPTKWFLVRGSAGTGFRAPSLTDLYASQATSVTANGTRDPIKCPTFDPNNPACSFQFTTVTGGNPGLQPEKSRTFTLGTVISPVRNLDIDLDAYWIYLRNAIAVGGLSTATILQNAQTATTFANFITRDANGNIISISQTNANLFKTYVEGVDLNVRYAVDVGPGQVFSVLDGSYTYKYANQNPNGTWTSQLDFGLPTVSGIHLRWRHTLTIGYQTPDWSISGTQHFQKGYHDGASSVTGLFRDVSPYDTFDVQASYSGLHAFQFTLGATDVFNRVPPYANYASSANNFIGGYDISYGDPRGRFVYATISYTLQH
jgi:iron complex outermembrane recepter protein